MAAPRQKEMNESAAVVATTTFVAGVNGFSCTRDCPHSQRDLALYRHADLWPALESLLQRFFAFITIADADRGFNRRNEDLPIPDLPGSRRLLQDPHDAIAIAFGNNYLHFDLRNK